MLAVLINVIAVIIGSATGTFFGNRIGEKYTNSVMVCLGICTAVIGVQGAVATSNILIVIVCAVLGTVIGTLLRIDDRLDSLAGKVQNKLSGTKFGRGKFAEGFTTTTILFCVGTMTVLGSIEAGLNHNYSILITKSIMDLISSIAYSAVFGIGVMASAVSVLVIQGAIVLLAGVASPVLTPDVITEMSAVGGVLFIGLAINMIGLRQEKIKVGDMLPAIFLPIIWFPLSKLIAGLF